MRGQARLRNGRRCCKLVARCRCVSINKVLYRISHESVSAPLSWKRDTASGVRNTCELFLICTSSVCFDETLLVLKPHFLFTMNCYEIIINR